MCVIAKERGQRREAYVAQVKVRMIQGMQITLTTMTLLLITIAIKAVTIKNNKTLVTCLLGIPCCAEVGWKAA